MTLDSETMTIEAVVEKHLGQHGVDAQFAVLAFQGALLGGTWHPFTGKSAAGESLDAIENAIRRIAMNRAGIVPSVARSLLDYFSEGGKLPGKGSEEEILRTTMMLLIFEPQKLLPAIEAARNDIERNDEFTFRSIANVNVKAIQTVHAAIVLWDRFKKKPAPRKSLNPASSFANYLRDVFQARGVGADVKSAHRAWAETHGNV